MIQVIFLLILFAILYMCISWLRSFSRVDAALQRRQEIKTEIEIQEIEKGNDALSSKLNNSDEG